MSSDDSSQFPVEPLVDDPNNASSSSHPDPDTPVTVDADGGPEPTPGDSEEAPDAPSDLSMTPGETDNDPPLPDTPSWVVEVDQNTSPEQLTPDEAGTPQEQPSWVVEHDAPLVEPEAPPVEPETPETEPEVPQAEPEATIVEPGTQKPYHPWPPDPPARSPEPTPEPSPPQAHETSWTPIVWTPLSDITAGAHIPPASEQSEASASLMETISDDTASPTLAQTPDSGDHEASPISDDAAHPQPEPDIPGGESTPALDDSSIDDVESISEPQTPPTDDLPTPSTQPVDDIPTSVAPQDSSLDVETQPASSEQSTTAPPNPSLDEPTPAVPTVNSAPGAPPVPFFTPASATPPAWESPFDIARQWSVPSAFSHGTPPSPSTTPPLDTHESHDQPSTPGEAPAGDVSLPAEVIPTAEAAPPDEVAPPDEITSPTEDIRPPEVTPPAEVAPPTEVTPSVVAVSPPEVTPPAEVAPPAEATPPAEVDRPAVVTPPVETTPPVHVAPPTEVTPPVAAPPPIESSPLAGSVTPTTRPRPTRNQWEPRGPQDQPQHQDQPQGHPQPNVPYPSIPPSPPKKSKKKSKAGIIIGIIAGIVILGVIAYFAVPKVLNIINGPAVAKTPTQAVQGYLEALADGHAQSALGYSQSPPVDMTFLVDPFYGPISQHSAITDINVPENQGASATSHALVDASYTVGTQKVTTTFVVEKQDKIWVLGNAVQRVNLSSYFYENGDIEVMLDGTTIPNLSAVYLLPGTYDLEVASSMLTVTNGTFTIEDPNTSVVLGDISVDLTPAAQSTIGTAIQSAFNQCVAQKSLTTDCFKTVNNSAYEIDPSTITWSVASGSGDLSDLDLALDPGSRSVATADVTIALRCDLTFTNGYKSFGTAFINSVSADFTDPNNIIITFRGQS